MGKAMGRQSLKNTDRIRFDELSSLTDSAILDSRMVDDALNQDPDERLRALGAVVGIRNAVLLSAAIWVAVIVAFKLFV